MLTGMMHAIGKLYVLTRAVDQPKLLKDLDTLQQIMTAWHPQIGKSIPENWEFPATPRLSLDKERIVVVLQEFAAEVNEVCSALGS